jgi:hypothetical protein
LSRFAAVKNIVFGDAAVSTKAEREATMAVKLRSSRKEEEESHSYTPEILFILLLVV